MNTCRLDRGIFHAGEQHSPRDTAAFISMRDAVTLLARSIQAPVSGFHIVHGVSNNRYKRLAIEQTRKLIGYEPADDAFSILGGAPPLGLFLDYEYRGS
jgi:uronate dehydrogenase